MKPILTLTLAALIAGASANAALAVVNARFIIKSTGQGDVAQAIKGLSLGNCLTLDAVALRGGEVAVAIDCDSQAYALQGILDIMSKTEGAGDIEVIDMRAVQ
jgi:hypothetical protein